MRVLVFGQGKSGTTVLAKTIQNSLPDADLLMEPKTEAALASSAAQNLVVKILYGQWVQNLPGLTRIARNKSGLPLDRIVKLIRDPRDQAISFLLYNFYEIARDVEVSERQLEELVHLIQIKERSPASISFGALCSEINRVMGWDRFTSRWLLVESGLVANHTYLEYLRSLCDCGYLMRYENFIRGDTQGLESYLGFELSSRRDVGEFARTRRSASCDNWQAFFTSEDVVALRSALEPVLDSMGYNDWELRPAKCLDRAHFSEYVTRLIREARPNSALS
jgi:hypothetical protein